MKKFFLLRRIRGDKKRITKFSIFFLLFFSLFLGKGISNSENETSHSPSSKEILKALEKSYPKRITKVNFTDSFSLEIDQTQLYLKEGRLLPLEKLEEWKEYRSNGFYYYSQKLPELEPLTPQLKNFLKQKALARYPLFNNLLYQATSHEEIEASIQRVSFMGFSVNVHKLLVDPLSRVESDLKKRVKRGDVEIQNFFDSLETVGGFHWRNIAGSQSRSYHSYGIAIDLIPKSYEGKFAYWQWVEGRDWETLPYSERWEVPPVIVEAFYQNGFVWGGTWRTFDNIHFEYRPELIYLSKLRK